MRVWRVSWNQPSPTRNEAGLGTICGIDWAAFGGEPGSEARAGEPARAAPARADMALKVNAEMIAACRTRHAAADRMLTVPLPPSDHPCRDADTPAGQDGRARSLHPSCTNVQDKSIF